MKKKHLLLWITLLAFLTGQPQVFTIVSGTVTDEATGEPVTGHEVFIDADSLYSVAVLTNESGSYTDTIVTNTFVEMLHVATMDLCTFLFHDTLIFSPPQGAVVVADFEICTEIVGGDCQAGFYAYADSLNPNLFQFVDQSTPPEAIDSWSWSFGDGTGSTLQNPSHEFGSPGIYPVCLTITTSPDSCSSTWCFDVTVGNIFGCQANFYYYPDSLNPSTIQFIDQSEPAGQIASWYWEFGEGATSAAQNPAYTFGEPGIYPVCLTITAFDGQDSCISTQCIDVIVGAGPECQADFYYAADSSNLSQVVFYDASTPANLISSWSWDFDDGTSSSLQNPVHTFGAPGIYIVCLTIEALTGEEPCTSTFCLEVFVQGGATYSLGGNTFAGIYQLDQGFAYAYKVENGAYTEVYSQVVDTLGYYFFNPFAGDYYIKVEPTPNSTYYSDYLPTYYGDAIHWEDAQLISLNQNIFTADINLVPMAAGITGEGTISGHIYHGGDKSGNPAFDVQVMLANASGDYVGMDFTDEEGYFGFTGLGHGTYTLYAEVLGKSITPKTYQITADNLHVVNVVMTIEATNIAFGVDEVDSRFVERIGDPYPNPSSGLVSIDVKVKEPTEIRIRILNLAGQVLHQAVVEVDREEQVRLDAGSLDPGFYLMEIRTEDNVTTSKRFIKY